jgi:glycosyltransferase involved in cell wall biosynthesis
MPNTVLEAMACSLPVVASAVPGNDEVVVHGETGFLFPVDDLWQFVAAMRRLLVDPPLVRVMGETGRIEVATTFSWQNAARKYVRLLVGISMSSPGSAKPVNGTR